MQAFITMTGSMVLVKYAASTCASVKVHRFARLISHCIASDVLELLPDLPQLCPYDSGYATVSKTHL